MKGLEALDRIKSFDKTRNRSAIEYLLEQENTETYFETIEKELKALEIIRKKGIDVDMIKYHKNLDNYNFALRGRYEHLTQKEFDLLKEVLYED